MTDWRQETITLKDGKLRLFKRADTKSGYWQYQVIINGRPVIRSTKTTILEDATAIAVSGFYEILVKVKHDIPIFDKTFMQIAKEFISDYKRKAEVGVKGAGRLSLIESKAKTVFPPFFKEMSITKIGTKTLDEFVLWRSDPKNGRFGKAPTQVTINGELAIINSILKFAVINKFIPSIPKPEIRLKDDTKRDAFTHDEVLFIDDILFKELDKPRAGPENLNKGLSGFSA
jgi:hypothetical protein